MFNKAEGLSGLYTLSENAALHRKYIFWSGVICLIFCLAFVSLIVVASSEFPQKVIPWLYLLAGTWGLMVHVKYTEYVGLDLIAYVIDKEKIENELSALGKSELLEKPIKLNIVQYIPSFLLWFSIVFVLTLFFGW